MEFGDHIYTRKKVLYILDLNFMFFLLVKKELQKDEKKLYIFQMFYVHSEVRGDEQFCGNYILRLYN